MIQLEAAHRKILEGILSKYGSEFYVFGSRAKGNARPLSDLDLLVKFPLPAARLSELREELEESNLPFRVDLSLWDEMSPEFRGHIQGDLVRWDSSR